MIMMAKPFYNKFINLNLFVFKESQSAAQDLLQCRRRFSIIYRMALYFTDIKAYSGFREEGYVKLGGNICQNIRLREETFVKAGRKDMSKQGGDICRPIQWLFTELSTEKGDNLIKICTDAFLLVSRRLARFFQRLSILEFQPIQGETNVISCRLTYCTETK